MSTWTHINGQIRVDGLPRMQSKPDLGIIRTFEQGNFEEATVPCGSEGSLQYSIATVGDGLVWLNISIWGDLRDYHNSGEIVDWIEEITKENNLMIRQGFIQIEVESIEKLSMLHYGGRDKWELISHKLN